VSRYLNLRLLTTAIAAVGVIGCGLDKQEAPALTGPSTLGQYVEVTVSPDRLLYDGTSQAVATASVHGPDGKTKANVSLRWQADVVVVNNGVTTLVPVPVEPSPQVSTTGSNGAASTVVRAPVAPNTMPTGSVMLRVTATPIGDDASQLAPGVDAKPRTALIQLVPLDGSSAPNRLPVPDFTISPPAATIFQTVTFDASLTRDEGVVCDERCTYTWDFGPNVATKSGKVVTVAFPTIGVVNVTLFVTDQSGGTANKTKSMSVNGPAAPVAAFIATPGTVTGGAGGTVLFDASQSTVGAGATIVSYSWDFGDGSMGTGQTASHTYGTVGVATPRTVTLTITDDLGRKNQKAGLVTVNP
jgi:hypothetical protein